MKITLLILALTSLVFSGYGISNKKITELLIKPTYKFKPIEEIVERQEQDGVSDETLDDITDINDKQEEIKNKDSISVQDILDF